jgi:hypothetical protein
MIDYKITHINNQEHYRFNYPEISNKNEFEAFIKFIITKCQIKNKFNLTYSDIDGDLISIKSLSDVETMLRLRLLGQTVRLFIEDIN